MWKQEQETYKGMGKGISLKRQNNGADDPKGIPLSKELFKTSPKFNIGAFAALIIISVIYAFFWS